MFLRGDATRDEGTKHTNSPFSTSGQLLVYMRKALSVLEETQKHIYWKVLFCRSSKAVNQHCRSSGPWKPAHMREHYHKMLLLLHPSHHLLQETSTMEGHINLMKIWKNDQSRNSHGIGSITHNENHHRVGSKTLQVTHWWDLPQRTVEFPFPPSLPCIPHSETPAWLLPPGGNQSLALVSSLSHSSDITQWNKHSRAHLNTFILFWQNSWLPWLQHESQTGVTF